MKSTAFKKALVAVLCVLMVASCIALPVSAKTTPKATVTLSMEQANYYYVIPEKYTINADLSDKYGYVDKVTDAPSTLDALIKAHELSFAEAFTPETKDDFLKVDENGFITRTMGQDTTAFGFAVNGMAPNDGVIGSYGTYTGYTVNQAEIKDGDTVQFFFYDPNGYYGEIYTHFLKDGKHIKKLTMTAGETEVLRVQGYSFVYEGMNPEIKWKNVAGVQPGIIQTQDGEEKGSVRPIGEPTLNPDETDDPDANEPNKGTFNLTINEPGKYLLVLKSNIDTYTYVIPEVLEVTVISLDRQKAAEVEELIDAIADADNKQQATSTAREAYDALTKAQQALVENTDVLIQAEKALKEAENNEEVRTDASPDTGDNGIVLFLAAAALLSIAAIAKLRMAQSK